MTGIDAADGDFLLDALDGEHRDHEKQIRRFASPGPALSGPLVTSPGVATRRNILQAFWRRRWWIVLCTVFGVVGGYVYMKKQVRIFNAYSRIYIQENAPNVLGASGIETQTGIATQIEVIRSTPLLSAVAERPEVKELGFDQDRAKSG